MLCNMEGEVTVTFPMKDMEEGGIIRTSEVATRLLKLLKARRTDKDFGYFLSVTELLSIGKGQRGRSSHIFFPVKFRCRTFLPQEGEVMIGTVHRVGRLGVFLKCGPMKDVFLPLRLMPSYSYVEGDFFFLSNDQSKIEMNTSIRFKVLATRFSDEGMRQLRALVTTRGYDASPLERLILATIDESSLGPIQSAGSDAEDFESIYPD